MLVNTVIIGSVLATVASATISNQAINGLVQRNDCPPPVTVTVTHCEPGTTPTPGVPGEVPGGGGVTVPPGEGKPPVPGEGNPPGPGGQVTQVPPGDQGNRVPGEVNSIPPGDHGTQTPGVPGEVVPSSSPAEHTPGTTTTPATGASHTMSQVPSGTNGTSTTSPTITTAGASGSRLTTLGSIFAGAATLFAALALY